MAKKSDIKNRILAIERIFQRKKAVTTSEIQRILCIEYDIEVERKTVYDDIAVLTRFMPIDVVGGGCSHKYVLREFMEGI